MDSMLLYLLNILLCFLIYDTASIVKRDTDTSTKKYATLEAQKVTNPYFKLSKPYFGFRNV